MIQTRADDIVRVVHHVFLPPKLPQKADEDSESALIDITLQALLTLRGLLLPESSSPKALENAIVLLENIKHVNGSQGGTIDETGLHKILTSLPVGCTLAANVQSQNAAVLVTRQSDEQVVFEEFELSPLDAAVIKTKGRLTRSFPGLSIAVPSKVMGEASFSKMIANTLSTMCHQQVPGMQPQSLKSGVKHDEIRDTTDPAMVSELFMGVLAGVGAPISISTISKNTRDEVLWDQALAPWRRSPTWLLIRVSLQLVILRSSDGSHTLYKEVMVFIMSRILEESQPDRLPPALIFIMAAKIQRRLRKLSGAVKQPALPKVVMTTIEHSLGKALDSLAKRWESCQQADSRDLNLRTLATLDFERDTLASLPALDSYITATHKRPRGSMSSRFMPVSQLIKYQPGDLPILPKAYSNDPYYAVANLGQFEQCVARHVNDWVTTKALDNATQMLHDLMVQYHRYATHFYEGNPEAMSVMVLTIFELWVACDKAALRACPWLDEYDPGITVDALQNLLLPSLDQMRRLFEVEKYIDTRRTKSIKATKLLFASNSGDSFASKYFDQSDTHSELRARIVSDAEAARKDKLEEFKRLKKEYLRLDSLYNAADHKYITKVIDAWCDPPETEEVHSSHNCDKCTYMFQRDRLSIQVHEWPLPRKPVQVKAVVFELRLPSWFGHWSNARLVLLQDLLKGTRHKVKPSTRYLLSSNDPHLTSRHFRSSTSRRIDLLSQTKPVLSTHYSSKAITTLTESQVCVPNGLDYQYYDSSSDEYPGTFTFKDTVAWACTYPMPCQALQRFLFRPASAADGQGPNVVIASQDDCPENMTLEEYKEFGTLPLGRHVQWPNILLQLGMPSVDFKKPETTLLFLQCAYQAGPLDPRSRLQESSVLRDSHMFFRREENGLSLLSCLSEALQRVKSNWESSQAVFLFVAIASRALSLSAYSEVQEACLTFLETARDIAFGWVLSLREKAYEAVQHEDRTRFISKSVEVALICTSTFDIDDQYIERVLARNSNASILVQTSIVVQEGEHSQISDREPHIAILDLRRKRLLLRVYKALAQHTTELDKAIQKSWSAYMPGSGWRIVSEAADHWVTTDTLATKQAAGMSVHYNMLSGELLVNGLPLDQPPHHFRSQPLYSTLFGKAMVEIMPSTTPGFQFSTKREVEGFSVQLGMSSTDELVVRATKGDTTYETIPSGLVGGAYPVSFARDYIHWFNASTNTVQLRPVQKPWTASSPAVWTLSQSQTRWRLANSECSVAILGSSTSQKVSKVLEPLADPGWIHNLLQSSGDRNVLNISIPTLRMDFSLAQNSDVLLSKQYRSMAVDSSQYLGTLVGLRSKIVLKHMTRDDRMVLLPESKSVQYQRDRGHTAVSVSKTSIYRVHAIRVDPKLGRLVDDSDLSCKLFLAYLHALTSFCLVDPLTQKTGTEQALMILKSAAVRSFDQLSQEHIDMLEKIADLSPGRCYYPAHKRVMQTIAWDHNISFLSQHGHFVATVKSLLQQAEKALLFLPDSRLSFPRQAKVDQHLLQRDNIRSATFRVSGYGAESHTVHQDQVYAARDRNLLSQRAVRASAMSRLLFQRSVGRFYPALIEGSLWLKMRAFDIVHGPQLPIEVSSLKYDATLLATGHDFVLQRLTALHRKLAKPHSQQHKFMIMIWLSTMAFHKDADVSMLQSVAMFFNSPILAQLSAPERASFRPKSGNICSKSELSRVVEQHCRPLKLCPEQNLPRQKNEKLNKYENRRNNKWQLARGSAVANLVDKLATQWPCENPETHDVATTYIRVDEAMKAIRVLFKTWYDNRLLHRYLVSIEWAVSNLTLEGIAPPRLAISVPLVMPSICGFESEQRIFLFPAPELPQSQDTLGYTSGSATQQNPYGDTPLLECIIQTLEGQSSRSKYEIQYVADLGESLHALVSQIGDRPPSVNMTTEALSCYLKSCTEHVDTIYGILKAAVTPETSSNGNRSMFQRPRLSPTFLLRQLSRHRWHLLSQEWKECIVRYAIALTSMQRAERLVKLSDQEDLINELRNSGHQNWDPMKHPETLLMEVESNFLVRDVQAKVAEQMQNRRDGNNAVMQLNMGEGKSSVIVPMVAAALADGKQLLRVIVAKPQSKQMAQMLISKLGGLLDRRVYYIPISRSLKLDRTAASTVHDMLHDCVSSGGVLLIQPEHILSFQLMVLECYVLGRQEVGQQLMSTQDFLEQNARDVVDESDENFNVRFELIYTMGTQRPIELSPDRWFVLQQVLNLVRRLAPGIAQDLPHSLDYHPGTPGSFPRVRILRPDAGSLLQQRLAEHICNNGIDQFQISRQPEEVRKAVYLYITKAKLSTTEVADVEDSLFWTNTTKPILLLIRGIIACGVLDFVLGQKRWRVNYGLASRTPPTQLAVPYRAKDSPSPRSEFSHPDVVIALTCLSYYYGGLSDEDMFIAMGCLLESDQSDIEYQAWVRDAPDLPAAFKQLQGINLKDRPLCISVVFPALRFAKSVIDFFLSHIVFPKQMKEFPHKLSASGWDIGKRKTHPVTGFSGTNDSRCLLPIDVHQLDHDDQKHTNALVLEYILQPENGIALLQPVTQDTSDAEHLLTAVLNLTPSVEVILDVGAQILELNNVEVAKAWLKKHEKTKEAAVFVNDDDELCVVDREDKVHLLRTSSFITRLDSCLIFLDEAHTRGIDLRLPSHYRAAVTLGAGLTKDRLVQACMRMRKLGKGQTVVFCISQEIHAKIIQRTGKAQASDITVSDVILWSISETHVDIRRSMPLWAVQGERFVRQDELWQQVRRKGKTLLSQQHAKEFQEDEAQSLDQRFRPRQVHSQPLFLDDTSHGGRQRIAERCQQFEDLNFNSSTLQEEQERELSPEIEQERQVQRAPPAEPAMHRLHKDILSFALSGLFISDSAAYMPAFEALKRSSAAKDFSIAQLAGEGKLLVSADFAYTVVSSNWSSHLSDSIQRPVQWLLASREKGTATLDRIIIISPYEANQLYKRMESSNAASLHIYKPRCNSGYASLDQLDFHIVSAQVGPFVVPRRLAIQLDLFAGQLYISSYEDYNEICSFLGLSTKALTKEMGEQGWKVAADGFILSDEEGRVGGRSGLRESPVNFFKILMSKIRRNGDGISKTHMGHLLEGKIFQASDFEEST
ncbi:hypothetical protein N0V93_008924 [Gnomoniopsis smithogilvyi]|uniref:ubiquitinyl hydrolase 1 n=1 Tax=Gnomoniopsis smithogilvyi TaxID=1191159 RepID=A0A9W8YJV1_9PEZI|nr:hypothetical protein N0V93_008924 [Gnomoniopsis smithogilvyi]